MARASSVELQVAIKSLHVPFCFYPDPVGGTEVYVNSLARHLQEREHVAVIAAPGQRSRRYDYGGLSVRRFATGHSRDLRSLYGEGDPVAAGEFGHLLDTEQPDVVHLHALSPAVSVRLVRETKQRGIPVVFTYHTPAVSCQRGTLMEMGNSICNGRADVQRCTRCTLQSLGVPAGLNAGIQRVPPRVGQALGKIGAAGGPWTALRMSELLDLRHSSLSALFNEVDALVAVCDWVGDLLLQNGVSPTKLLVSRQGVASLPSTAKAEQIPDSSDRPLRLAFLGRLDPTKGIDVVLQALLQDPDLPVRLDIYGIVQDGASQRYQQHLETLCRGDSRITLRAPVAANAVVETLRNYHLTIVPSQLMETGPLVVLESFAAGVPVLGSNLGGIAELVRDGLNGILVPPASVDRWLAALRRLAGDEKLLDGLKQNVGPPRTMDDVAVEMASLYKQILAGRSNAVLTG